MRLGPEYDDQLVDLIYATVFGEAKWQDFLLKLDEGLPGGASGLLYHDARRASGAIDINSRLRRTGPRTTRVIIRRSIRGCPTRRCARWAWVSLPSRCWRASGS